MVQMQIKLKEDEKAAFSRAAELSGMSLSAWIRFHAREAAEEKLRERSEHVAFIEAAKESAA
jgi:uncharacterized protein (DUF1778 family)